MFAKAARARVHAFSPMTPLCFGFATTCVVILATAQFGCGPPLPPSALPQLPAAKIEPFVCGPHEPHCEPLMVDQPAAVRTDLGEIMTNGVAVVAVEGSSLRLLTGCKAEGAYGFLRQASEATVRQIDSADQLAVNLPTIAAAVGASVTADFQRGGALDLATKIVGRKVTTRTRATPGDLVGGTAACEGATHFVHAVEVGAFSLKIGSRGVARTALTILARALMPRAIVAPRSRPNLAIWKAA